ncbi:MAG TPA: YggS family pyridoxal phosphate-dependent enzyme [Bacteroidota bacterium]|nr:YggS family pyridoxal phosphate-dependent enzyme [Bacteroidota bacterium]
MVAENIKNLLEKIDKTCADAGRVPDSVKLIAVSKTFGHEMILEAVKAGVFDIGESYVQELSGKHDQVSDPRIRWHFIGHLQSNKVKFVADWIHLIHSVDNDSVATEIQKRGAALKRKINVLVEVNTSGETTKFGLRPEGTAEFIGRIGRHPNVKVQGLMTVGPLSEDMDESRRAFRRLKKIFDDVNREGILHEPMTHLSMGMSHDFPVAIEEGSTMVRIGTAIFGSRTQSHVN